MERFKEIKHVELPIEEFLLAADNEFNRNLEPNRTLFVEACYARELGCEVDESLTPNKLTPVNVVAFFAAVDAYKKPSKKKSVKKEADNA